MNKLYIELTSMCNFNCKTCFRNNWFDETQGMMSDEILQKLYGYIGCDNNLRVVSLSGTGEPLLHKKVTEAVRQISLLGKKTEIITNAALLDEKMSMELINAGLDMLWVSYDKAHTESADFLSEKILKNIEFFNKIKGRNCKTGFTFVVENGGTDKIYDFAEKYRADEVNISGAIPYKPFKKGSDNSLLSGGGKQSKNYCPFVEEGKCFVKWNGNVAPCMQLLHNSFAYLFEEKRKVFSYSFGNVCENSLDEIWNSKKYTDFRKKVRDFEFPDCTLCDGCDDRLENKKDCLYNDMPTCGACLWAQDIAKCP